MSLLHLFVNGNLVHDENGDGSHAPLTFATEAEAEAHADKLFAALPLNRQGRPRLARTDYTIVPA